jgi:hypothetical protein
MSAHCACYPRAHTHTHTHTHVHTLSHSRALNHTFLLSPEDEFGIFSRGIFQLVCALQFTLNHVPICKIK